ncbi:MAG: hypothetical protein JO135_09140 [Candidatus Eremiobacteraeota bacterium]|nr:hypothetical protein [Candidatus Eremiobacteraeota bacterium]
MKQKILASALTAALTFGTLAPALADGAASTRNILIGGAAAAIFVTNYNHKKREKQAELREQARRQQAYRSWFYSKYGYYPTDQQFREWYYRTYGVNPK